MGEVAGVGAGLAAGVASIAGLAGFAAQEAANSLETEVEPISDEEATVARETIDSEPETVETPLDIAQEDSTGGEWGEQELQGVLNSESLLGEVTPDVSTEDLPSLEELSDVSEIDIDNLSEDLNPNLSEATSNIPSGNSELLEMFPTEKTSASEVSRLEMDEPISGLFQGEEMDEPISGLFQGEEMDEPISDLFQGEEMDEPISGLFQGEESDDLDFLEMLPTDDEITADLSEVSTTDDQDSFAGFFSTNRRGN